MILKKITDRDLQGYGVIGMADTPNLSAREMQEKVEEVVRSVVIPVFNRNIDNTVSKQDLAEAVLNAGAGDMTALMYDTNADGVVNKSDNGLFVYTHSGNSLTGTGDNGKFKATSDGTYSMFYVNGIYCTVKQGEDSEIDLVAGAWYTFILDGDTINFKHGGAGLNFNIVGGTTRPVSPKENTIWVNTDLEITNWGFDPQTPNYLRTGGVWFKTGTNGNMAFNALKKNSMFIYPQSCMQWDGTQLVKKDVMIYRNGQWQSANLILFEDGIFAEIGGWSGGTVSDGNITATVSSTSNHFSTAAVNLTDYSTLSVTMSFSCPSSQVSYMGVSTGQNESFAASVNLDKTGTEITYTLDVSSLTGDYYIVLDMNFGSGPVTYSISKITLI